jgi:type IV secretion system protein VirB3
MAQEQITKDMLFIGATRPPMVMGVTLEAFLLNGIMSSILFLGIGNPLYLLVCIPIHLLAYLICLNEPRRFKLIALKIKCMANNRNRIYWRCNSYSPFVKNS